MTSSSSYPILEESQAGEARRAIARICQRLGGDDTYCGRVSIVITELARNLVLHAGGGELVVREIINPERNNLEVLALDHGPGMRNVMECLRDGYSTAGTAGTGFGSIRRLADQFEVYSVPDRGTVVWARLGVAGKDANSRFQVGGVSMPLAGEEMCGDAWEVAETEDGIRVIVADGLGHGAFAAEASMLATATFRANPTAELPQAMDSINRALNVTRGAAGAIVDINLNKQKVYAVGMGNIAMRLVYPGGSKSFSCENGTLGTAPRRIHEFSQEWKPGSLLIMHSDGITTQWNLDDYPGLANRHPSIITGVLYRDFRRERDDSTVVVVRLNP